MAAGTAMVFPSGSPPVARTPFQVPRDRVFETWRASIWTAAAIGTAALATTALNAIPAPRTRS